MKRKYFQDKLEEKMSDVRGMWEVLGEALTGKRGKRKGSVCKYFVKDGKSITDKAEIANGFCDFYCQVGPKLAAKIPQERDKKFQDYLGARVHESLVMTPTTQYEVEAHCLDLEAGKGMGWDGVSPRVIKGVSKELSGSLSRLYNC